MHKQSKASASVFQIVTLFFYKSRDCRILSPSPQQTHPTSFYLGIRLPAFVFQNVHIHTARAGFAIDSAVPAKAGVCGFEEFFAPEVGDAEAVFAGAVQDGEEDFVLVVAVGAEGIGNVHEHGVAHADVERG